MSAYLALTFRRCLVALTVMASSCPAGQCQEAKFASALYREASELQNAGKFAEASAKWQQFVKEHSHDDAVGLAYQALGTCRLETEAYPEAIEAFQQALKRLPHGEKGADLRWNLALAWQRRADKSKDAGHRGKLVEALQALLTDKTTSKDRQALANFYLARAEYDLGKREEARKRLQVLVDSPPDKSVLPASRLALAHWAEDARAWPEAIRRYQEFLKNHADHAAAGEARLGLAEAYFQDRRWTEAEKAFADIKENEKNPGADYASFRWAELAEHRDDLKEAARRWQQFLDQAPKSSYRPRALAQAAETWTKLKDHVRAANVWQQLLREFPDQKDIPDVSVRLGLANLQIARAQAEQGEYGAASKRCHAILDSKVANLQAPALYLAGYCALKDRKFAEAVPYLQKVRDEHPRSEQAPAALYGLGIAYESTGANAKALAAYRNFLKSYPDHALARQAEKRVTILQAP